MFQSFSDKPLRKHRGCGGALHKELHAAGVIFKGPGFYTTDSRSSKSKSKSESDSKSTDSSSDGSKKKPSEVKTAKSTDKSDSSDS